MRARPRRSLFDLRGEAQQGGLVSKSTDELAAHRQAVLRPMQRQRDRRLSRCVEQRRKREELERLPRPRQAAMPGAF